MATMRCCECAGDVSHSTQLNMALVAVLSLTKAGKLLSVSALQAFTPLN